MSTNYKLFIKALGLTAILLATATPSWALKIPKTKSAGRRPAQAYPGADKGVASPNDPYSGNPFKSDPSAAPQKGFQDDFADEDFEELSDDELRLRMEQRAREKQQMGGGAPQNYPQNYPAPTAPVPPQNLSRAPQPMATPQAPAPTYPAPTYPAPTPAGGINMGGNPGGIGGGSATSDRKPGCLRLDPDTGIGPDVVSNFDFPDADIVEIAKTLGRLTCLNFILDKEVTGRISIVSNAPITIGDAWKAFLTALDVRGFALVPSGKYLRIAKQRDAKDKQLKLYSGAFSPDNDAMITRVVSLKYINAEEVRRVFMNIVSPNTRMTAYDQTNTLIITDTGSNIKKLTDLIGLLDVEGFDEGLEVIKIKYASAEDIAKLIDQLLPSSSGPGGFPAPGAPGAPRFGPRAARKTKEGGVVSNIIADGRTNSLIVNGNAKGVDEVRALARKLDTQVTANSGSSRIHVKYLQYADAEQVATTLNNLTAGSTGTAGGAAKPGAATFGPGSAATLFEGAVKVAADKPTNSVVITASPTDYILMKRVISKLDVARDQVYVEAVIMEMSMSKALEVGSSLASPNNKVGFVPNPKDLAAFLAAPAVGLQGLSLGFGLGKEQDYQVPGTNTTTRINSVMGLVRLLQTNANANVLATPQILTLDNQEASIEVGETVPVPVATQVQGAGTAQSFNRERVSLSLKLTPQINKISNFVKLNIEQRFDDFSARELPSAIQGSAFGTTTRQSKTTVIVQDQDTVVLGGLIRDKVNETTTKVPVLGDIPVLGWLFRSKRSETNKTNLLVFITPRVIKQYQAVRSILDRKIQERDDFIERSNGGDDPFKNEKMNMIRSLPPLAELKSGIQIQNTDDDEEPFIDENDDNHSRAPAPNPSPAPEAGMKENSSEVDASKTSK